MSDVLLNDTLPYDTIPNLTDDGESWLPVKWGKGVQLEAVGRFAFFTSSSSVKKTYQWNDATKQYEILLGQVVRLGLNQSFRLDGRPKITLSVRFRDAQLQGKPLLRCSKHRAVNGQEPFVLEVPGANTNSLILDNGNGAHECLHSEFEMTIDDREFIDITFHCTGSCQQHTAAGEGKSESKFWELVVTYEHGDKKMEELLPLQVLTTLRNPTRLKKRKASDSDSNGSIAAIIAPPTVHSDDAERRERLKRELLELVDREADQMPLAVLEYVTKRRRLLLA